MNIQIWASFKTGTLAVRVSNESDYNAFIKMCEARGLSNVIQGVRLNLWEHSTEKGYVNILTLDGLILQESDSWLEENGYKVIDYADI